MEVCLRSHRTLSYGLPTRRFTRLASRKTLTGLALIAAAVTATATTGLWLLPRKSTTDQRPLPPNTSVRGLWVKNLDAGNEWVPDLVAAQNQRIWLSGLVQSSALGDSANAVLHLWESSAPIDSGTSIVHISFSNGKAAATSQYQVLVRHGPQWFFALDVSSAVLTDNTGSQLAWLGNKSVTVSSPTAQRISPLLVRARPPCLLRTIVLRDLG